MPKSATIQYVQNNKTLKLIKGLLPHLSSPHTLLVTAIASKHHICKCSLISIFLIPIKKEVLTGSSKTKFSTGLCFSHVLSFRFQGENLVKRIYRPLLTNEGGPSGIYHPSYLIQIFIKTSNITHRAINSEIHLHTPTSRQCSKRCLLV